MSRLLKGQDTGFSLAARLPPRERLAFIAATLPYTDDAERIPFGMQLLELAILEAGASVGTKRALTRTSHADLRDSDDATPPTRPPIARRLLSFLFDAVSHAVPAPPTEDVADLALQTIARHWQLLPEEVRQAAPGVGRGRWLNALARLVRDDSPDIRAACCAVVAGAGEPELAAVAVNLLSDAEPRVASAAERALLLLADAAGSWDLPARRMVEAHVLAAVASYPQHNCRGALHAALRALDPCCLCSARTRAARHTPIPGTIKQERSVLGDWLVQGKDGRLPALRGMLRGSRRPEARLRAWQWLTLDHMAPPALERLAVATTLEDHDGVLASAHLLAHPRRAARFARNSAGAKSGLALPDADAIEDLSVEARRGLARCARVVPLPAGAIETLIADEDPLTRWLASRAGVAWAHTDAAMDAEAAIASSALLAWSPVGVALGKGVAQVRVRENSAPEQRLDPAVDPVRWLERLARSPHARVRSLAQEELSRASWRHADGPRAVLRARRALHEARAPFLQQLGAAIESADPALALRAASFVRRLGLQRELAPRLAPVFFELKPSGPQSARLAATLVAALGEAGDLRAAEHGLQYEEARVRANAVEAVARATRASAGDPAIAAPSSFGQLIDLKCDGHHRVRANALRGLLDRERLLPGAGIPKRLYEPVAVEEFIGMLRDRRPSHRLAAVWLSQRLVTGGGAARFGKRWTELAGQIDALARDEDSRIRHRAVACIRRVRAERKLSTEIASDRSSSAPREAAA